MCSVPWRSYIMPTAYGACKFGNFRTCLTSTRLLNKRSSVRRTTYYLSTDATGIKFSLQFLITTYTDITTITALRRLFLPSFTHKV
jgi:hypothetical protein